MAAPSGRPEDPGTAHPQRPRRRWHPLGNRITVERFNAIMRIPIIVSAILPLIVVPSESSWVAIVVGILSWLVFLVDYVFHARKVPGYARTGFGIFDLVVVIVTAPWFLIPGVQGGGFVVFIRLARVLRIVVVSPRARRLFNSLGRVGAVAAGVLVVASLVAYYAEHPTNPEFANVGDALWWGVVTLTTVGYGDIVPKTSTGRWAGVVIMVTGIAVLGVLAGSLASFFRLDPDDEDKNGGDVAADDGTSSTPKGGHADEVGADDDATLGALVSEVAALRAQVALLAGRLVESPGGRPGTDPPDGDTQR